MLKYYQFILAMLCFSGFSSGQITITTAHMPKSGDTIRYSTAAVTSVPDVSKTGADVSWDFKDLEPNGQDIYAYKASGQTPYLLNFGFSAIGLKIADSLGTGQLALQNVYDFYKNSSTGWEGVGIGFSYSSFPLPQSGKHTDPDEVYKFPLTYSSTANTTFSVKVPIMLSIVPVGNFFRSGTRSTIVDGWGKISTPYAQNVDCIRVKSIIDEQDSISVTTPALNFGFSTKRVEYKWLSTSERIPLLEISGTETGGNFVATTIRYRDIYRDISGPLTPEAAFEADNTNPNPGDTVRFTDKSTGIIQTRTWTITPSSGFSFVKGTNGQSANPVIVFQNAGKYTVSLKAENISGANTQTKTDYIQVKSTGSTKEWMNYLKVTPNPTSGKVSWEGLPLDYKLYNAAGQCILAEKHVNQLILYDFPAGIYTLQLSENQSYTTTIRILKY